MLRGIWSADNQGVDIRLNGVSTGIRHLGDSTPSGIVGFTWTSPFILTQGFVTGLNTLDFVIRNDALSTNDPTFNPTGLRVDGLTIGIADQVSSVGDAVSLSVAASFNAGTTSFIASGLPLGLTIDANTGVISGAIPRTLASGGYYNVTISASSSSSETFRWLVDSYPAYLDVVAQANATYSTAVITAGDARLSAILAARTSAQSAATQAYNTYLAAYDQAYAAYKASTEGNLAAYEAAVAAAQSVRAPYENAATAQYNSDLAAVTAAFDIAADTAQAVHASAIQAADIAYDDYIAPYDAAYQAAVVALQQDPNDPNLQADVAAALTDLDAAVAQATSDRDAAYTDADDVFATALSAAQAVADAAATDIDDDYEAALSAPNAASQSAEALAWNAYMIAEAAADALIEATVSDLYDTYIDAVASINTGLSSNESLIQQALTLAISTALGNYQASESTAWVTHSVNLAADPVRLAAEMRHAQPDAIVIAEVPPFAVQAQTQVQPGRMGTPGGALRDRNATIIVPNTYDREVLNENVIQRIRGRLDRAAAILREGGYDVRNILTGDVFDRNTFERFNNLQQNQVLITINGVLTNAEGAQAILNSITAYGQNIPRAAVLNGTHGLGDAAQILFTELGLETIADLRAAAQIEIAAEALRNNGLPGEKTIYVVAHSQGTEVFYRALNYLTPATKSMIVFTGLGGQRFIASNAVRDARNYFFSDDLIPQANGTTIRRGYAWFNTFNVYRIPAAPGGNGHLWANGYQSLFTQAGAGLQLPANTRPIVYGGFPAPFRELRFGFLWD